MSLQQAAKYLQSKGRGDDSVLVHMTPKEVNSLQAIAMAHGGSLSINPETGLPEAGFLKSILPMIIGAGVTAATGGAAAPWMIGLGLGGVETLRTGSIQKGLMAGLGAYGGAGLAGGLMGAGAGAAQKAQMAALGEGASQQALNQAATQATQQAVVNPFVQGATSTVGDALKANLSTMGQGVMNPAQFMEGIGGGRGLLKYGMSAAAPAMMGGYPAGMPAVSGSGPNPYNWRSERTTVTPFPTPDSQGRQQRYFTENDFIPITQMAEGGPIESMSYANSIGANTGYPMADIQRGSYATPYQQPISQNVVTGSQDTRVDPYSGAEINTIPANPAQFASGGVSHLGDYSDGGRLLRGPGDGVSDSIPAMIGSKQPARLADGEFVVPARIVSELGNGSTEAGARKLYAMMDRVQKARGKTVGKGNVAKNSRADKHLPA